MAPLPWRQKVGIPVSQSLTILLLSAKTGAQGQDAVLGYLFWAQQSLPTVSCHLNSFLTQSVKGEPYPSSVCLKLDSILLMFKFWAYLLLSDSHLSGTFLPISSSETQSPYIYPTMWVRNHHLTHLIPLNCKCVSCSITLCVPTVSQLVCMGTQLDLKSPKRPVSEHSLYVTEGGRLLLDGQQRSVSWDPE